MKLSEKTTNNLIRAAKALGSPLSEADLLRILHEMQTTESPYYGAGPFVLIRNQYTTFLGIALGVDHWMDDDDIDKSHQVEDLTAFCDLLDKWGEP